MRRQFAEAIDHYVRKKVKIYSMAQPTIIMDATGGIHTIYNFDKITQKTLDQLDALIEHLSQQILGA